MRMRALLFDVKGSREKTETFSRTHTIYLIWIYNYIHCCMCNNNNNIRRGGWDSWDCLLLVVSVGLFLRVSQFWKRPDTLWSSSCALPQGPLVLLVAGVSGWFWAELFGRGLVSLGYVLICDGVWWVSYNHALPYSKFYYLSDTFPNRQSHHLPPSLHSVCLPPQVIPHRDDRAAPLHNLKPCKMALNIYSYR